MQIKIGNKLISNNHKTFFIAEAGVNHNGKLSLAYKLVDMAKRAGADAIKFQTFKAKNISTINAPKSKYHIKTTGSDKKQTWFELLKSQELTLDQHIKLIKYCKKRNIIFLSTPYDEQSVDLLLDLGVEILKIASTDANNLPFLKYISRKKLPIILSTAMCNIEEVSESVKILKSNGLNKFVLMQCTGNYPALTHHSNLKVIETYKEKFKCIVGYSDHTMETINPIAATALGAKVYEKHITLDKRMNGPDHRMSMNEKELYQNIQLIRKTEDALGSKNKYVLKEEKENRIKLRKSLVAIKNIKKNTILKKNMIGIKRPGNGLEPKYMYKIIGKTVKSDIKIDEIIKFNMLKK